MVRFGTRCAAACATAALTYVNRTSPGSCTVPWTAAPVPGMCVLHHFPAVGNGVSAIHFQNVTAVSTPSMMRNIGPGVNYYPLCVHFSQTPLATAWGTDSNNPPTYSPDPRGGSLCAYGPGINHTWPRGCGIVSYRKSSVNLGSAASNAAFVSTGVSDATTGEYTAEQTFTGSC